jgi:hypothetical protein
VVSQIKEDSMVVKIIPNDKSAPAGKLADAEVHFVAAEEPLSGLKLIGFSIWERKSGGRNVTFPARSFAVNGERRSFALLRPLSDPDASNRIRDRLLQAYDEYERQHAGSSEE